jgi:hypothetical protein
VLLAGEQDFLFAAHILDSSCDAVDVAGNGAVLNGPYIHDNAGTGVNITSNDTMIRAVTVTNNGGDGIHFGGDGSTLTASTITSNGGNGVSVTGNHNLIGLIPPSNLIYTDAGGSLISGNGNSGVMLSGGASFNTIEDNFVGTDALGSQAFPNHWSGVFISGAPNNLIGGMAPGAGNVISGNGNSGITIIGAGSVGEAVQGNKIGTNFSGQFALGNAWSGIFVGQDDATGPATDALIGGTTPAASNVISGNGNFGIWVNGPGATGITIEGNNIGTDITGEVAAGNAWGGVLLAQGASDNTLSGNLISGNPTFDGVRLTDPGTSGNLVAGNRIGTDATSTQPIPNGFDGVAIASGATNNTVGGPSTSARNLISANSASGVDIYGVGTTGNAVLGNFIGTDDTGTKPLGNAGTGVYISQGATGNLVGGTGFGSGNTIADNGSNGVSIVGSGTSANVVQGNRIGTDDTGLHLLGNHDSGVAIFGGATGNFIGGSTASAGNLIDGNGANGYPGVGISGPGTSNNVVQGNKIGTDPTGTRAMGNLGDGIDIFGPADGNTIGGPASGQGNAISANFGTGVTIDTGAAGNVVQGNMIGTDATGRFPLGNATGGVDIWGSANGNLVGGTNEGAGNVISANGGIGVALEFNASDNVVQGNKIGTSVDGEVALGNTLDGVRLDSGAFDNLIGGASPGAENVISSNLLAGVTLTDSGTSNNVVSRNFIGTDLLGARALGNLGGGIAIVNGAGANVIGTTEEGGGNIISGNGFAGPDGSFPGVAIAGDQSDDNVVQHNMIGLAADGESAVPNAKDGIDVFGGADGNTIGGSVHHAENLISGNAGSGVVLSDFATNRNVVQGNLIGTDYGGNAAIPNGSDGVLLLNTHSNTVGGGTTPESRNIISGNAGSGVVLSGSAANTVAGNAIGVGLGGTPLGNRGDGVALTASSAFNVLGGTSAASTNVICANGLDGVSIDGAGSDSNLVEGNLVGVPGAGAAAMGNGNDGVAVTGGASDNVIGGSVAGARNIISGNGGSGDGIGVLLLNATTTGNLVSGNFIGTNSAGAAAVGNDTWGIIISDSPNNTVGGIAGVPGEAPGNVISGNHQGGVGLIGSSSTGDLVLGNLIGTSADGLSALGNAFTGVLFAEGSRGGTAGITGCPSNDTVGGTISGARNIISANNGSQGVSDGVHISGLGAQGLPPHGILIQGNFIGTDITGTVALGNGDDGVQIDNGSFDNTIGGTVSGAGNIIAFSGGNGVTVGASPADLSTGNAILRNAIFANAKLGIDLGGDGVTLNDSSSHSGPNLFQDFPVLSYAVDSGGETVIAGSLSGIPDTAYRVELFSNRTADPSGHGQGRLFLTFANVTTDSTGHVSFTVDSPTVVAAGQFLSATATDQAGNTSEFSADVAVSIPPTVVNTLVAGTGWTATYLSYLQGAGLGNSNGYSVPVGSSAQLMTLPWTNLAQVHIVFSEAVKIQASDLAVYGLNTPSYGFSAFSYNALTFTATWTFASPLQVDKLLLDLDGHTAAGVTNLGGGPLDGTWTNGQSRYPSGNGQPGTDFQFRINVLPGDVDANNGVNLTDYLLVRSKVGTTVSSPGYNFRYDVLGQGVVTMREAGLVRSLVGSVLPAGDPGGNSGGGGMGAADSAAVLGGRSIGSTGGVRVDRVLGSLPDDEAMPALLFDLMVHDLALEQVSYTGTRQPVSRHSHRAM